MQCRNLAEDRLTAANQVQTNRTRHLNWHNNRRAGTLRQNLSRSHNPLPMPGQLFTNPSSELNQSRQGSQILASEMDSTLHKATRTRADLKTRTPRTDNGRGDTKGIRTTSTPANPGRPAHRPFLNRRRRPAYVAGETLAMGRRKMTSHPRTDGSLNQTGKRPVRSLHNRPISMFPRRFCTVPHAAIPARATRVNSYSQKLFAPHTRRPLSTTTPKYTARSPLHAAKSPRYAEILRCRD